MQAPSIGRIVHYQRHGSPNGQHKSEPSPAIITKVVNADAGIVGLAVFNPNGLYFNEWVEYGADAAPGTWRWPAFVPPTK